MKSGLLRPVRLVFNLLRRRRVWQWGSLVLLNLPLLGLWTQVCAPVLNCHSCPWAVFACPIGVAGHLISWHVFPLYVLGTMLVWGALFGRIVCGWVCPFGLVQDYLHKIPSPKWRLPRWTRYLKYGVLLTSVILVPFFIGLSNRAFFCSLCPVGTLESMLPAVVASGDWAAFLRSWARTLALILILLFGVVAMRSFCKTLCPIGAFLALCNRFSGYSLHYNQDTCSSCELCLAGCPMDVDIAEMENKAGGVTLTASSECILCLNCTRNCHTSGLSWSFWNLVGGGRKR